MRKSLPYLLRLAVLLLIWWGITLLCPHFLPPGNEKPELISAEAHWTNSDEDEIEIIITGLQLLRSQDLFINGRHVPTRSMTCFYESIHCTLDARRFPKEDPVAIEVAKRYPFVVPLPIYRSNTIPVDCSGCR